MDAGADAGVRRATAEVARHRAIDIRIGWLGRFGQECRRAHDLPALAITALRHIEVAPRLLERGELAVLREPFNRRHFRSADFGNRRAARPLGDTINMHRARATFANAAAVFGADEANRVAQNPEEWGISFHLHRFHFTVHI